MQRNILACCIGIGVFLAWTYAADYRQAPREFFYTPQLRLYFSACEGDVEGVRKALEEGAAINKLSGDGGYNALHYAIHLNHVSLIEFLLEKGADPNFQTGIVSGYDPKATPLVMATVMGHLEAANVLLKAGADPYRPIDELERMTAISFALQENRGEFLDLFLKTGFEITRPIQTNNGLLPALTVASRHGSLDQVTRLVEDFGVPVNPEVPNANTSPLFTAIRYGNTMVVKYLIGRGADIGLVLPHMNSGWKIRNDSSLGLAARKGRVDITRVLLENGAKPDKNSGREHSPVCIADAKGFDRLLALYESYGYESNCWVKSQREETSALVGREEENSIESLFTAKYLEGNWSNPVDTPESDAERVTLAVISDEFSRNISHLLEAKWSVGGNVQLLEREHIDRILKEHHLRRSGIVESSSLDSLSRILDADVLVLVKKIDVKNAGAVSEFRLIEARRGILLDTRLGRMEGDSVERFCEQYIAHAEAKIAHLTRGLNEIHQIAVTNVRADFGSAAGIQMERQARRLLEMELSKQPDILLMERQDLEKVRREQHLSGDLDTGFQAASGFVDARLDMNHSRDGIRAIHLRFDPKKGPARVAHVVCGEQSIHEALQQAIAELFTQSENTSREVSADTYQDYERLFKEARWLNKVGLHRESLRYIRNAVALHDKDRRVWSLYLESLRETFPKPSKAGDLFDAKNFERVISHERERLLVLDRLYRIYLEEGKGRPFLFVKGHDDFGYTLATLNMVTLRRKYKESIRLLEEEYLKLVRRRVIPLFSLYKTRGYRRTDSDLHLGKTLKNLRNFKTVAPERLESIVKELVVAHSVQYTDPEYWPNDSHRQFSYSGVPYRDLPYGENLDDNITDWVIAYACPYIGHEFLQNIFRGHWMGTLKKSRKYINERVEESKNLRKKMSFRQRLLKRFMSGLHYGNYRGWMSGDVIMPKIDELKLDMARVWQPPDRVAIGLIGHLSEDSKLSLNVTKEFFGLEKDPVQLQVTRRMLERFSKEDSWLNQRSSNIEKKLESLIAAAEKGDRVTTKDSSLSIGKFHVSVWHPETYGYGDFRLMHTPVLFNNTWYVLATNGRPSRHKTNDYLLFTIHSETFETHAKRFNSPHFPRHSISDVALNEDWLFFCPDEFAPITCLKLEDLTTHTIKNVRGDASGPDGFVVRGKYYAMVTPLDDLKNRSLQPKERTHLLMEYDPSRRALKILVNSRRNPAVTVIDEIIPHVFAMQYSESHDSIVFHATTRRLKAYSLALDSQEATRIEGEFEAKWRLYLDEEMTEAYRKVGIIDSSGSHWFKSTGISGEWRKFVSPNSIVLTSRESPSRFQHKAVEFIPSYTGLSDPDLQAVNKEFMGERNRALSTLRFNTRAGCFLVGENGVAFFKTSDLGRALAVSDILPRR